MAHLGIDLGTTHSLISVLENGEATLIPNAFGDFLTPSIISIDKNQKVYVGNSAKERLITHPNETVANFKRMMGSSKTYKIHNKTYTPVELSALVLKEIVSDASARLKQDVSEVVISVPAYFNEPQRKATMAAAALANLSVSRLINEPTAAAIDYCINDLDNEIKLLVLDLGGGTFDVTVLELFDGIMEVHASAGNNHLGGEDFTEQLLKLILTKLEFSIESLKDEELNNLRLTAEMMKRELSTLNKSTHSTVINGKEHSIEINKDEFNEQCKDLLISLTQPIEQAIMDAKLTPQDFDEILLVGGSSRMPIFQNFLTRMFGRFPKCSSDPDLIIAKGAALQAGLIARNASLGEVLLTDVMPYSLGVGIFNPNARDEDDLIFSPILERNTTIPVSREESYFPVNEDQSELIFNIYQGESRYVKNNIHLGKLNIKFPKNLSNKTHFVRFTFDSNGILEIIIRNDVTGKEQTKIIQNNEQTLTDEEIKSSLKKLDNLKVHPKDQQENSYLLHRANRIYEHSLGDIREYINQITTQFEQVLASQDLQKISKFRKEFKQRLDEIEKDRFS